MKSNTIISETGSALHPLIDEEQPSYLSKDLAYYKCIDPNGSKVFRDFENDFTLIVILSYGAVIKVDEIRVNNRSIRKLHLADNSGWITESNSDESIALRSCDLYGNTEVQDSVAVDTEDPISFSTNFFFAFSRGFCISPNILCLVFTCIMIIFVVLTLYTQEIYFLAGIGIFYVIYIIESFQCETRKLVSNSKDLVGLINYYDTIRNSSPIIKEHAHCYHYETRYRTITDTTTNSDGSTSTSTRTESYQEQVTMHRDACIIEYNSCIDCTEVLNLAKFQISNIKCKKSVTMADNFTQQYYNQIIQNFHFKHAYCDSERTFYNEISLNSFKEYILAFLDENMIPTAIKYSYFYYWLFTVIGLSWIYRLWFIGVCGKQDFHFIKQIKINDIRMNQNEMNYNQNQNIYQNNNSNNNQNANQNNVEYVTATVIS